METNKFELTGKITFVEIKFSPNTGKAVTRTLMSKKGYKEGEYDTYPITFFGVDAETYANDIQKGNYVNITGKINVNKYEKDGKVIERFELIGINYKKVKYDENARSYIPVEEKSDEPWNK